MDDFATAFADAIGLLLAGDAALFGIVALSLQVSLVATVIAAVIGAPAGAALAAERLRYGLRCFFDHLLLSAAGLREGADAETGAAHHGAILFGGAPATDAALRLGPLPAARARAYLEALVADLLGGTHAYFLPCEAVFRVAREWAVLSPDALARAIEAVRRDGGGVGRFGPAPAPESYPAPEDSVELVRRRFGLYVALAGLDPAAEARA